MSKLHYHVVKHDGGWAYMLDGTYSEAFATREAACDAARLAAAKQHEPGESTYIEYQDAKGRWHRELSAGTDRPDAEVS
jgi:hypothetical protein